MGGGGTFDSGGQTNLVKHYRPFAMRAILTTVTAGPESLNGPAKHKIQDARQASTFFDYPLFAECA